jgi:hypothetical protein
MKRLLALALAAVDLFQPCYVVLHHIIGRFYVRGKRHSTEVSGPNFPLPLLAVNPDYRPKILPTVLFIPTPFLSKLAWPN